MALRAAYRRIADEIAGEITSGHVAVGSMLPSKRLLAARHNVSVGTIEKAVEVLAGWGLVETAQGVGVSVISRVPEIPVTNEERFADLEARVERLEQRLLMRAEQGSDPE